MTRLLTLTTCLILAISILPGCVAKIDDVPTEEREAWFWSVHCSVEERRRFTHAAYDWRKANDKANLARDIRTNNTLTEHCQGEKE